MPSIRVKRSAYSSLVEPPTDREPPSSLAALFSPNAPDVQGESLGRNSGRPRATTSASRPSRIRHHLSHWSLRDRRSRTQSSTSHAESRAAASPFRSSLHDGLLTVEGVSADVMVRSDGGEPGLIGSALSLHSDEDINEEQQDSDFYDDEEHHHDNIVEHLDVIDPQIATVSSLTNAANAILIPPMSWYSRKPVVVLSSSDSSVNDDGEPGRHYEDELDRHVNDVLKRRDWFRRTLKGVWSFLKTPLGILTGIYGFLVVFWGAAIVIFLIKIINFHNANTRGFWIEVSSQVENALFTVIGIGLIPSRCLDTYRVYKIWMYKRRTRRLRKKAGLPELFDEDDLPDPVYDPNYVHVLTEAEEKDLHRQQVKFQHHQTWYRAHGTETHRAFPINTALLICCLNDGNSIFQIMLCGTMWGLNRFQRPAWSTGCLIPASFLCGILSAVSIFRGGNKTKRVEEVRERLKAALAMEYPDESGRAPTSASKSEPRSPRHEEMKPTVAESSRHGQIIEEKT